VNPFRALDTQYKQEKYYRSHFNLLQPTARVLGSNIVQRIYGSKSKQVEKFDYVYDIDFLQSSQLLLNCRHVADENLMQGRMVTWMTFAMDHYIRVIHFSSDFQLLSR
jgi:hypothetical protein